MNPSNVLVKRKRVLWLVLPALAAFVVGVWWVRSVQAEGIPTSGALHYTGTLEEEGLPVAGTRDFVVFLWTDPSSDDPGPACTTTATDVPVDDGRFRVDLSDDCVQAVRENPDLWIEVIVDDASFGRERIGAVPYAVEADNGVPTGSIQAYVGQAIPSGWLLCDGSEFSRTEYPELFETIGTTFGSGDGSTTFGLPNLGGRVPVGQDVGQAEFDVIGGIGGERTHKLSVGEMPPHSHGANDPGHVHPEHSHGVTDPGHSHKIALINWANPSSPKNAYPHSGGSLSSGIVHSSTTGISIRNDSGGSKTTGILIENNGVGSKTTGISIDSEGGGNAHNNLQPMRDHFGVISASCA